MEKEDGVALKNIIRRQVKAGAAALDLNTDLFGDKAEKKLNYLYGLIREVTDLPMALDSSDEQLMYGFIESHNADAFVINSISTRTGIRAFLGDYLKSQPAARVIIRLEQEGGPPGDCHQYQRCYAAVREFIGSGHLPIEQVFIDLMIRPVATSQDIFLEMMTFLNTLDGKEDRFIAGLSNVSFGLPRRSQLNVSALAMLWGSGVRNYILNIGSRSIRATLSSLRALSGLDANCLEYCRENR